MDAGDLVKVNKLAKSPNLRDDVVNRCGHRRCEKSRRPLAAVVMDGAQSGLAVRVGEVSTGATVTVSVDISGQNPLINEFGLGINTLADVTNASSLDGDRRW